MTAGQPTDERPTAGQRALAEAARLESALVYGRVIHEHKRAPASLTALVAEAELVSRAGCGEPVDAPVDESRKASEWDRNNRGGRA